MNPLMLEEKIEKILLLKRMLSVQNLIQMLDVSIDQVQGILSKFKGKEYIRISHGKSCASGCSSCSSCPTQPEQNISENDIIISLLFARTEDYADQ